MSYLHLPGASGEYVSAPDSAALSIVGDIDIQAKVALVDWTPATSEVIVAKWETTSDERSYIFEVEGSTHDLQLRWSEDGIATTTAQATATPTVNDEDELWVRVTLDVDGGAGGVGKATFYTGGSGETPIWVQLGDTVDAGSAPTSIYDSTAVQEIGSANTGDDNQVTGEVHKVIIYSDLTETTSVFDADFTGLTQAEVEAASFTEDSDEAATVTLNGDEWAYVQPKTTGILSRAELILLASDIYTEGSPKWPDLSGNNHHAQYGSAAGADSNDPLFLAYDSEQYLYLPGINANYCSTPDSAALSIAGDVDLQAKIALDDWTPAANNAVIAKWTTSGNQRAYRLLVATNGTLQFNWSEDGTATVTKSSSVAPTVSDGDALWIRVTLDVDGGAGGDGLVTFYTGGSGDTPTWVQLGTTQEGGSVPTSIADTTAVLEVGGSHVGTASPLVGKVYDARVYNGIEGTLVFHADFTDENVVIEPFATFAEKSSNGATVTINRAASGRLSTVVDRAMFLLGTDDYFEVPDHADLDFAAAEDFTLLVAARTYLPTTANDALVAKTDGVGATDTGYALWRQSAGLVDFRFMDGTNRALDQGASLTAGQAFIAAGVRNTTDDDAEAFLDGAGSGSPHTDPTTATLANALAFRVGRLAGAGTSYHDGEIHAVALFREALSDTDIARVAGEIFPRCPDLLLMGV